MKTLALIALGAAACAGCSSLPQTQDPQANIDTQYVAAVESAARRQGVQVIWLQMPRKSTASQ